MRRSSESILLRLKYVISIGLCYSGLNSIIRKFLKHLYGNLPVVTVLCYHSITDEQLPNFESQLNYLLKKDFKFISGKELLEIMSQPNKFSNHCRYVCLTFDDCYENNYSVVRPILLKRRIPAIFFAVSAKLGQIADWNDGECNGGQLMTKKQLKEMALTFDIGAHSQNHVKLGNVKSEIVLNEIENSKKELTELTEHKVLFFAYPSGSYNSMVFELLSKFELEAAFTINQHSNYSYEEKYELGRYLVNPEYFRDFKLKVMGGYDWFYFFGKFF